MAGSRLLLMMALLACLLLDNSMGSSSRLTNSRQRRQEDNQEEGPGDEEETDERNHDVEEEVADEVPDEEDQQQDVNQEEDEEGFLVGVINNEGSAEPAPKPLPVKACSWLGKTGTQLAALATHPNKIVDPATNKACMIFEAAGRCPQCACPWYTKYSTDGGATWLGFTFEGTPGGTGCVFSLAKAISQLQDQINQGLCGCSGSECSWRGSTGSALLNLARNPNFIGQPSTGKRCTVFGTCRNCVCPNYVKYSVDNGRTWLGYTFEGTPGGTGCVFDIATAQKNLQKQISEGRCGC